jgi:transcriptional regulator with XRE-family HTH domain
MSSYSIARKIRARKLGLLLVDARTTLRRTQEECARVLGVSIETYQTYELGSKSPSLPEMEVLAFFLGLPLDHFWGNQALAQTQSRQNLETPERIIPIRNHALAEKLRETRLNAGLSLDELGARVSIAEDLLGKYEAGDLVISVPELETITTELQVPLATFLDQESPVGQWRIQQENIEKFLELPQNLQEFVSLPVNRPYVELAQRLSGLSVERLRSIAEGLLEITY